MVVTCTSRKSLREGCMKQSTGLRHDIFQLSLFVAFTGYEARVLLCCGPLYMHGVGVIPECVFSLLLFLEIVISFA